MDDLLAIYSDKNAVPFFNSDNCHGDDFYYTTKERVGLAIDFWEEAYSKGWFVRWSVVDKNRNAVIRIAALKSLGWQKSESPLVGSYDTYFDYWEKQR